MNAALADVFLTSLPKSIRDGYDPIRMASPNTVFLHMFDWFIKKYRTTTAEEREDNRKRMTADWHPINGFKQLHLLLNSVIHQQSERDYPRGSIRNGIIDGTKIQS